ncbi:MAG: SRPBCC domain-containing protein [Armatimonadota bacterium]
MPEFKLALELRGDKELVLKRQFRAPQEMVFKCFSDPDIQPKWVGNGMGTTTLCVAENQIGGVWRHTMDMGEHGVFDSFGQILEFEAPNRVVRSYVYNVPVIREAICTETAEFSYAEGVTTVEVIIRHFSKENRDGHAASGIEYGAGLSYDALEALLAQP